MGNTSQSYGASPDVWDHTGITCHLTQVNAPYLSPSQAGRYAIYLPRRDGRLSWPWCWLYTEMFLPVCILEVTTWWRPYRESNSRPF